MATLTAYTAALETIGTLDITDTTLAFTYAADGICIISLDRDTSDPLVNGHYYKLDVEGMADTIYARLIKAQIDDGRTELSFERLSGEAAKMMKDVLGNLDAQDAKHEGKGYTLADLHAMQDRINRLSAFTPFSFTWDRNSPWVVYRESEGNNP